MNLRSLSTLPIAALVLAAVAGYAAAAPSPALPPAQPAGLTGYQQVVSASIVDAAGMQTSGSVLCPRGSRVVGGGAAIDDSNIAESVRSSIPRPGNRRAWDVSINNSSSIAGSFRVFADCVSTAPGYTVVAGPDTQIPAHTQTAATATCPTGTVPLGGGGGLQTPNGLGLNLNSSFPLQNGWRVYANNSGSQTVVASAYVICGAQPTAYQQVAGPPAVVGPSDQQGSSAECPSGTVVLGGGGLSSSQSRRVSLNTTAPSGSAVWAAYENNQLPTSTKITAYAVCGAATA